MVNQDRVLSSLNTEIRNPNDGRLAKLSPNSVIVYKIQRQSVVPAPISDVFGQKIQQQVEDPNLKELEKIFNEEKIIAKSVPTKNDVDKEVKKEVTPVKTVHYVKKEVDW